VQAKSSSKPEPMAPVHYWDTLAMKLFQYLAGSEPPVTPRIGLLSSLPTQCNNFHPRHSQTRENQENDDQIDLCQ
jgi:hypothetical protein